jgi:hypothetical protein
MKKGDEEVFQRNMVKRCDILRKPVSKYFARRSDFHQKLSDRKNELFKTSIIYQTE